MIWLCKRERERARGKIGAVNDIIAQIENFK